MYDYFYNYIALPLMFFATSAIPVYICYIMVSGNTKQLVINSSWEITKKYFEAKDFIENISNEILSYEKDGYSPDDESESDEEKQKNIKTLCYIDKNNNMYVKDVYPNESIKEGELLFLRELNNDSYKYKRLCYSHEKEDEEDEKADESTDEKADESTDEKADESTDEKADEEGEKADESTDEKADEEDEKADENNINIHDINMKNYNEEPFIQVEYIDDENDIRKSIHKNLSNFYVEGNIILDYTFMRWFMYYFYNIAINKNYKIECFDRNVNMFELSNKDHLFLPDGDEKSYVVNRGIYKDNSEEINSNLETDRKIINFSDQESDGSLSSN